MEPNHLCLPKSYTLMEFVPGEASEEVWETYFRLSEMIFREWNPKGRLPDRDLVRRLFSTANPLYSAKRWMVFEQAKESVASASLFYDTELSPDYDCNKHVVHVSLSVAPAHRRKKIAASLLKYLLETAKGLQKDTVVADADNPVAMHFCKHLRGEMVHEEVQHRLYMEEVDWRLVEQWLQRGRTKSQDTKIEFFQECPEKDIEEFCKIYTEIINQRPTGEMDQTLITTPESRRVEERYLQKKGIEWYTGISREQDGRISGLTDIMYNPDIPHRVDQYFTGVQVKYRRRGLGKRLKAEMLVFIKDRFPGIEYIATSTARNNRPMRAINKELGFQPTKTCFMFRWALGDLDRQVDEILHGRHKPSKKTHLM